MTRAPINGDTLRWARQLSQVDREDLASAVGTRAGRIEEFEAGVSAPTFRQLTLIASKLDRPLGFFFAAAPEHSDVPETADFRGRGDEEVPAALAREMKRAEQHRDAMLDLSGPPENSVRLEQITWENITRQANSLRNEFGLTAAFTPPESQQNQVFNFWRGLLETHGFLVFQTTKISLETFRGLSIHHKILPIILVNGADSAGGRTFTLFHELAHLVNRTSGLCILNEHVNEEAIANSFSANFLMPERAVRRTLGGIDDPAEAAHHLSSVFRVSPLAAAVRLRILGIIDEAELAEIRRQSDQKWAQVREAQKGSPGFVPPWRLRYRDLGNTYIGAVAQALEDRRVDAVDATYLLNARLPMVEQMLKEYYRSGSAE
ncbi:ImmA/IrrE family metallo-endopeptidase [Arthrobacter oryzae]|uniref:ImmA/IrrE family metallo-endopeptidase n=1 Tax=Arthrobacter oryzae TaxID=409290 RepID=A0A3N0BT90_9MICC|nr:XRE family transcriptional regulator [Arthrobacter oryzae]RNL51862.1 ImmA/IrrE family metallo-endopeptidase [Arthrobacter oryzae]